MEKRRTFKIGLVLGLLVAIVVASAIFFKSKAGDVDNVQNQELEAYFLTQKKAIDLDANLNGETPIGRLYASMAYAKAIGSSEDEAAKEAETLLIEDYAFLWYAETQGLQVLDSDVETYMNKIISDAKLADNYPVISAACEKAGITYEEFVKENAKAYKAAFVKDHFYTEELSSYSNTYPEASNEEFLTYWKSYKAGVIKQFQETTNYSILEKIVNNCIEQIKLNEFSVSELKNKDIFLK